MSDNKKNLKLKLSLEKETLRVLDDSQLHLLDDVMGGLLEAGCERNSCNTSNCETSCKEGSCIGAIDSAV